VLSTNVSIPSGKINAMVVRILNTAVPIVALRVGRRRLRVYSDGISRAWRRSAPNGSRELTPVILREPLTKSRISREPGGELEV